MSFCKTEVNKESDDGVERKICCIDSSRREIRLRCNLLSLRVFVRKF